MVLSEMAIVKKIFLTGLVCLCLFVPEMTQAGSSPVVTVGDSSSGGAINFEPAGSSAGTDGGGISQAGGLTSFETALGAIVTVASLETAVQNGSLGQDQISSGVGAGGSVVTLSAQMAVNVNTAATTPSVLVNGEAMTPLAVLQSLPTALSLSGLIVAMPNGEVAVSSVVSNLAVALTGNDPTLTGTTLNDAAMVLAQMINDGADLAEIQSVAESVAALLDAARNSLS